MLKLPNYRCVYYSKYYVGKLMAAGGKEKVDLIKNDVKIHLFVL